MKSYAFAMRLNTFSPRQNRYMLIYVGVRCLAPKIKVALLNDTLPRCTYQDASINAMPHVPRDFLMMKF